MRLVIRAMLVLAVCIPATAQTDDADSKLDLREVRSLRERAESDTALSEELRGRVVALYDDAVGALEAAAADEAQAVDFEREQAGIGRMVESLRAELERPERQPEPRLPDGASVEQAEARLSRERARLDAYRTALRGVQRLAEERADARNEISRRLGELDQKIEALGDELRAAMQRDAHAEVKDARRTSVLARREAAVIKIKRLRAELALLDERGVLIPWQVDQAQRRVALGERLVSGLELIKDELQRQEAAASLELVRERCREASALSPLMEAVAQETKRFAEQLWGADGVIARSESTVRSLGDTRKHLSDFQRIVELMRRKFEAYGYRGSLERWWPEFPAGFPRVEDIAGTVRRLQTTVPDVQFQLIGFEQERSEARGLGESLLAELRADSGEAPTLDVQRAAANLLETRRALLDKLIRRYGRFSTQLVE